MTPKTLVPTLVLTFALALPSFAQAPESKALNTEGFRAYRAQKFPKALELFKKAFEADDLNALAHYNYAATLGVLRKKGLVCQFDAYKSTILEHLEKAVEQDPQRKERLKTDRDFSPVRDTVRFQRFLGRTLVDPQHAREVLDRVTWFGPAMGILGSTVTVDFKSGSRVTLSKRSMGPDEKGVQTHTASGTYSLKEGEVVLQFASPFEGRSTFTGKVDATKGTVTFEEPIGELTDEPSECSA